jgi:DNA-binding transcriptional LysR family regulator
MRIDPEKLLVFLSVVEAGGVNRASRLNNKSQPALTRMVLALEEALDAKVFDRTKSPYELTEIGKVCFAYASVIRTQLGRAQTGLQDLIKNVKSSLTIGITSVQPAHLFSRALGDLDRLCPQVEIKVVVASERILLERLQLASVDFLIIPELAALDSDEMEIDTIFLDRVAIFCRKDHPILLRGNIDPEQFRDARWMVGPKGTLGRDLLDRLFGELRLDAPNISIEIENLDHRLALISQSDCLSIFAWHHVDELPLSLRLREVPFRLPQVHRPVVALMRKNSEKRSLAQLFAGLLRQRYEAAFEVIAPH